MEICSNSVAACLLRIMIGLSEIVLFYYSIRLNTGVCMDEFIKCSHFELI